jgi:hypothetical protein
MNLKDNIDIGERNDGWSNLSRITIDKPRIKTNGV